MLILPITKKRLGELSGRKDAWRVPFGRAHMNNLPTREFSDRSLPDVMLGVCVIARNSKTEQVLVAKRGASAMTFPNTFVYPGGHIEPGESLQACGSREIREETNIDVNQDSLRPVCLWLSTYPERLPMKAQHLVLVLEGTAASSEIRIDPAELDQALWMTPQQVVELAHTDDANNDFRIVPEGHLFATHLLLESQGTSAQHR
ncbi:MAG: hypothetical protein MHM6MM_002690 [Cercozoa sp. M6MM]